MDIPKALNHGFPGLEWNLINDTYEGLSVSNGDKPTEEELLQCWQEYTVKRDGEKYKEDRRKAILKKWPIHEQLEAYSEAQAGDSTKLDLLISDISSIKLEIPK